MKCLEYLHLDLCRELFFLIMCLYLVFTTHPVVCIKQIVYCTQIDLINKQHTLHQLIVLYFLQFIYL